jgi:hypothetical protein
MALLFRLLIGVPVFVGLCLMIVFGFSFFVHPGGVYGSSLAAFFAVFFSAQAYAIWRILLFRRVEATPPHPAVGGGSAGSGGVGGGPAPRPPDAGKPAPLIPPHTHHLAAAQELPPSDKAQSLPVDLHED